MIAMITKSKKAPDMRPTEQIGVRLDPELFNKFENIAKSEDRTLSQLARIAIREFVERKSTQVAA